MLNYSSYYSFINILKLVTGYRSQKQPPEVSMKKETFENFTKFTSKHLCQSLFFNKVSGLQLH